jgi:acetyl esterase/lipase
MKTKLLALLFSLSPFLLFSLSPFLLLTLSPLLLFPQSPSFRPANWDDIIARPWYVGMIHQKPVFIYLDTSDPSTGYFFVADKSIPDVSKVSVKWKKGRPFKLNFNFHNNAIKAKFFGSVYPDTIAGYIKTSRKSAIRLGISPELTIFLTKETPCLPASLPPCPPKLPPRYIKTIFPDVSVQRDISYGAATGYYSSMVVDTYGYDYQQILLDAMSRMYVNPTKEAIIHILDRDPVSFALTDLQGLRMDIYQPAGDTATKRPLILLLHGGAFIMGDKGTATIQQLANDFAGKGYVVAAVNYRMGFNPASKSSLERSAYRAAQDARAALRFLSYNASTYRIDPTWVFLGGSSAGAITALNAAFMKDEERPESSERNIWRAQLDLGGLDESTNNIRADFTVRAVVNLWGALSDTNIIDKNENIPVLSVHGDADKIVPYACSYPFCDLDTNITSNIVSKLYGSSLIDRRLRDLGIHSELITLHHAGHEPQYELGMYQIVMDTIMTHATEFYFKAMFNFPSLAGPRQIAMGTSPSLYTIPPDSDLTYYWQVDGGKLLPGSAGNSARIVWLADKTGEVKLTLVHKNKASVEIDVPVEIP